MFINIYYVFISLTLTHILPGKKSIINFNTFIKLVKITALFLEKQHFPQ